MSRLLEHACSHRVEATRWLTGTGVCLKVGLVTQWYDPEEGSAGIPGTIARSLQRRGFELSVITGFPNYPYGHIYPGYRQRVGRVETLDLIPVRRVPLYPSHERSAPKRMASYLSFAVSATVLGLRQLAHCDVALVYSTPATTALPALAARLFRRLPFVVYVQDLWPETVLASGLLSNPRAGSVVAHVISLFCNMVYRRASRIAVISEGMRQRLIERGVPAGKIEIVYNWVDEKVFHPQEPDSELRSSLGICNVFSAMYAGSLGDLQNLDVAIEAAGRLQDLTDFRLVLVGSGVAEERLRTLVESNRLQNVVFAGQRPLAEMAAVMRSADVQLVMLKDLPLFHATVPSKVQSILSCARPVVTSAPGDVAHLVERSGAGIACPPDDADALAEALRAMYALSPAKREQMGAKGHSFYRSELSEEVGSARLARLLEEAGR